MVECDNLERGKSFITRRRYHYSFEKILREMLQRMTLYRVKALSKKLI